MNASEPIVFTLPGITTDVNPEQLLNASEPIVVTLHTSPSNTTDSGITSSPVGLVTYPETSAVRLSVLIL